jgi:glycosyltransferase involved in cell wall biosynthesis
VWTAYQKWALQQAALFHVTSEEEVEALRDFGLDQPAALIPNGVQLPEPYDPEASLSERRRALFLSRLHPKKGLPMLLKAWAEVRPENWELVLVGPSEENHRDDLEEQVRRHELGKMVRFAGAVPEEEKWEVYRKSDLFVLPSHSENFGIVVAEALAAGLPAITTTGTPWQELEGRNCGWWVEPEAGPLAEALREAVHCSPKTLREMGQRGRALVKERYTWGGVAAQLRASYQWILGEADRPACVQV